MSSWALLRVTTPTDPVGGLVVVADGMVIATGPRLDEFRRTSENWVRAECKARGWTIIQGNDVPWESAGDERVVDERVAPWYRWVAAGELLARATRFDFPRSSPLSPLYVERTRDDADTWAVRWDGRCYTTTGWVMEPQPSSRDAAFLAGARYPRDEALAIAAAGPPCPYDTDGDGDCGKRYCPYCGAPNAPRLDTAAVPGDPPASD